MFKRFASVLLIIVLLMGLSLPAALGAETPQPTDAPTVDPSVNDSSLQFLLYETDPSKKLFAMKSILSDMHYYPSLTPDDVKKSDFFDQYTLLALEDCCRVNGLEYSEQGVKVTTYAAIMNRSIKDATATPEPTVSAGAASRAIVDYATGEDVTALQQQLMKLGYDFDLNTGEKVVFTPGVYDTNMLTAMRTYCAIKNIDFPEDNIISASLQSMLLGDSTPFVTPTPAPTEAPETQGKLAGYFTGTASVGGLKLPTWAMWLIVIVLVVVLVLVLMYFFMPSNKKKDKGGKDRSRGKTGKISFTIEYDGKKTEYRCDIDHTLKIGRNIGDFPINTDDLALSGKHCEIYYSGKTLMIRDYSTNGTFVNNKACNMGEYALHSGDTIKIGNHTLTIMF